MELQEKFLHHIWDGGHLKDRLCSVSGKALRIIYTGYYNTGRGPDFLGAIINLDGVESCGNIEIHFHQMDWIRHKHHEDHYYNDVILHVVFYPDANTPITIKENGDTIEVLDLRAHLNDEIGKLIATKDYRLPPTKEDYCDLLSLCDRDRIMGILQEFGKSRFENRVKRLCAMLFYHDFAQILHQGMMEAFGYDKNKYNMLLLAQELSAAKIMQWIELGCTPLELYAIFLGSSGLFDKAKHLLDQQLYLELQRAYESQAYYAKKIAIDWQLFRIRPSAHPVLRLGAYAQYLCHVSSSGAMQHLLSLATPQGDLLGNLYRLFASIKSPSTYQIGKSQILILYVNVLLPILYLYADKNGMQELKQRAWEMYSTCPPLPENYKTRLMQTNNPKSAKIKASAMIQQGMLEIFNRYCQYRMCEQCIADYRSRI